jgi:hypothetical protein
MLRLRAGPPEFGLTLILRLYAGEPKFGCPILRTLGGGWDKQKLRGRASGAEQLNPTLRKEREGWGTRTLVLGEENDRFPGREKRQILWEREKTDLHPFKFGMSGRVDYGS